MIAQRLAAGSARTAAHPDTIAGIQDARRLIGSNPVEAINVGLHGWAKIVLINPLNDTHAFILEQF